MSRPPTSSTRLCGLVHSTFALPMDPKRLKALAEYIPKGAAPRVRAFGVLGSILAFAAAPFGLLIYNSLYNGTSRQVLGL